MKNLCFDEEPEMSIVLAILSKVEFPVVGWWFRPNIWSLLVLIEMRIRIKTRLWQ